MGTVIQYALACLSHNQHHHSGYLCIRMAINNSLGTPEVKSPSLLTQSCEPDSRTSLDPDYLPRFLSLPLLFPILPLHSPSIRWTANAHLSYQQPPCRTETHTRQSTLESVYVCSSQLQAVDCQESGGVLTLIPAALSETETHTRHPMLESVYACSSQLQAVDCQENLVTNQSN